MYRRKHVLVFTLLVCWGITSDRGVLMSGSGNWLCKLGRKWEKKEVVQKTKLTLCHQNDLENIIPFVVIGLLYALTGPELSTALLLFRLFVGSRFIHTVSYVMALPQPSRGLSWMVGMAVTFCMAYRVLTTALLL
uniref:Microsomal glutathione S-transferase 1 n=1 Tax=Astyanax mexicanus TaxID=7994 RepID=A0A8B9GZT3_ASTMX